MTKRKHDIGAWEDDRGGGLVYLLGGSRYHVRNMSLGRTEPAVLDTMASRIAEHLGRESLPEYENWYLDGVHFVWRHSGNYIESELLDVLGDIKRNLAPVSITPSEDGEGYAVNYYRDLYNQLEAVRYRWAELGLDIALSCPNAAGVWKAGSYQGMLQDIEKIEDGQPAQRSEFVLLSEAPPELMAEYTAKKGSFDSQGKRPIIPRNYTIRLNQSAYDEPQAEELDLQIVEAEEKAIESMEGELCQNQPLFKELLEVPIDQYGLHGNFWNNGKYNSKRALAAKAVFNSCKVDMAGDTMHYASLRHIASYMQIPYATMLDLIIDTKPKLIYGTNS